MIPVCGSTVSYIKIKTVQTLTAHVYVHVWRQTVRQTDRERKKDRQTDRQIGLVNWPKYRYYGNTLLNAAKCLVTAL